MVFEVFICYKRDTAKDLAEHLKMGLEASGISAFLDIEDIPKACSGTEEWSDAVDEAIKESRIIVLILTFGYDFSMRLRENSH